MATKSKTTFKRLNNTVEVSIVDRYGHEIDVREIRNAPIAELLPNEQFVFVQWTADDMDRPTVSELQQPIKVLDGRAKGLTVRGDWAWGSAVKRGQTIGLASDWPTRLKMVRMVEDGQRVQRWMFSSGTFGGFKASRLRIKIVPVHTMTAAGPVEDGFGYIDENLVKKFARPERVELGHSRDNWTYWQRLPWSKIAQGVVPMILEAATDAANPEKMLRAASHSYEVKQDMVDADPQMIEHPFVAASLSKSAQSYFARLCSAVYLEGSYRIAVPTTEPTVCWPGHYGKLAVDRSPIDSNGNMQAVEAKKSRSYEKESKRILGMTVVQTNVSGKGFMSKECLGTATQEQLEGYDIVTCCENIKMIAGMSLEEARDLDEIVVEDVVVPFLSIWDGESLIGVNAGWAKERQGLDHDGDAERVVDCNDKPWLWQAIKELDEQETPKLPKTRRMIEKADLRADMIAKSMTNLVGMATRVVGETFVKQDRNSLAAMLGYKSASTMDKRGNHWIKVGTDGFKTDVDQVAVEKEIMQAQSNIRTLFGHSASWMSWDGSVWAFSRGLPPIIHAVIGAGVRTLKYTYFDVEAGDYLAATWKGKAAQCTRYIIDGEDEPVELDENQLKNALWPEQDGTCAMIARYALPMLQPDWKESIQIKPLTFFLNWAEPQSDKTLEEAKELQFWYNSRVQRVNWTDPKDIAAFRVSLMERVEQWESATKLTRWQMANAMWIMAHSARSEESTGNSVFMMFREEAAKIVKDKPGLLKRTSQEVILNGLAFQLPGFKSGTLKNIVVRDVVTHKKGQKIVRRVICGKAKGQQAPKDISLPSDLLAFIAQNCAQPEPGTYTVKVEPLGESSWRAVLS